MSNTLLPLGSSIGILGGGQLGRMIAMSCIELGYKSFVYCPKGDNPAVEVSSQHIIGDWNNDLLLNKFISSVDAVTIEFENIPIEVIQRLVDKISIQKGIKIDVEFIKEAHDMFSNHDQELLSSIKKYLNNALDSSEYIEL